MAAPDVDGHRRLVLMRHAKAEHESSTDESRRLSKRGRRDARAAGVLLTEHGDVPALVLVSTSQRTRDTWDAVLDGMRSAADGLQESEAWFDRSLYDSGPPAVVELLCAVETTVPSVLVIGHNPTISVVASALSDGQADPALEEAVTEGMPTAGLACFDVPVDWVDLNAHVLRLTSVEVPRG
jgi:phosphohistidine phosphatase